MFQPDEATHTLRDYVRQRANLVRISGQYIQRMQKALQLMNLKLTSVVGDVTGVAVRTYSSGVAATSSGTPRQAFTAACQRPR